MIDRYFLLLLKSPANLSKALYDVRVDLFAEVIKVVGPLEVACCPILVVRPQPVITTPLNVECRQIQPRERHSSFLEQVVCDLARDELVLVFHGRRYETAHHLQSYPLP